MMKNVYRRVLQMVGLTVAISMAGSSAAGEISYNERFALDGDRQGALSELIPGTEDFYYYNALHLELGGKLTEAKKMIDAGVKKYGHSPRLREMENRYALKVYSTNPSYSLKYIIRHLGLNFDHRQRKLKEEVQLPTVLDPGVITFETLAQQAFKEHRHTELFEESAFDYLVASRLTPNQRRSLLSRLHRPDYPGIVQLIVDDLNYKHSRGFGHHKVHTMLMVGQLEKCLQKKPELIDQTNFINTYLTKLRPNDDADWKADPVEYDAYLKRLLAFTDRLAEARNSLKANVIYKRLEFNIKNGVYDKAMFMRYIKMPRPVHYINPQLLDQESSRKFPVDLHDSFETFMALPSVGNDEQTVRRHLMHFLKDANDFKEYSRYIEHNYLKRLFAEVKLINGIGDAEKWYSLMDGPGLVKKLRDRIDIEILPTNNDYIELGEKVVLDVGLKNITDLTVKVYEINTTAYYRHNLSGITTAIELDGLVPNREVRKKYTTPPMLKHRESLVFPQIEAPGVYVIELIGNGVSSRAVIRMGHLTFTERIGASGHVFMLYNGAKKLLRNAVLWMEGAEYKAVEGEIRVPFSNNPKKQSIVFTNEGFSVLSDFYHLEENYTFNAGMYLGREQLISGKQCTLAVRPELLLNGEPVALSLLEQAVLTIRSTDLDGHSAEKQVNDFKLYDDKESTYTFRVPKRLSRMVVTLSGQVHTLSTGKKVNLSATTTLLANQIKATEKIEDVFLRSTADGYLVELLGRNGEAHEGRAVHLELKHHNFKRVVKTSLKTDGKGNAYLGELEDIDWVKVRGAENTGHTWLIPQDRASHSPLLHMLAGDTLRIPVMHTGDRPLNKFVSFLETRNGIFVRDCIKNVRQEGGYLVVHSLPAGDYSLLNKPDGKITTIRVTSGRLENSQLIGENRVLEQKAAFPLQIQDIEVQGEDLMVKVANSVAGTRVHIAMTRYITEELFTQLGAPSFRQPGAAKLHHPKSQYLSGRRIGDEYRYVMERGAGEIYPGNMLTRPTLLLNPWSPRTTEVGTDRAAAGEPYSQLAAEAMRGVYDDAGSPKDRSGFETSYQFSSFDFLDAVSPIATNLVPDKNGVVKLPVEKLAAGQQLHVYAVNGRSAVYRQRSLKPQPEVLQDLRLTRYLTPESHFTEQKRTSIVRKNERFSVADILSAGIERVDSVGAAYRLLTALNDDTTFAEFNFVVNWPEHSAEKKRELYKKYACHELHLFLSMKDPAFFNEVVRPYIANKKDPAFIDNWLLERPLESYLEPWSYAGLNVVERALLAQQVESQYANTARHLKDLYDLLPPDIEKFNRMFDSALRSSGLEKGKGELGVAPDKVPKELLVEMDSPPAEETDGEVFLDITGSAMAPGAPEPPAKRSMMVVKSKQPARRKKGKLMKAMDKPLSIPELKEAQLSSQTTRRLKARDLEERETVRQLYKKLEKTREWVESNYYHKPITEQGADLVEIDAFWKDYAAWDGRGTFLSGNLIEAGDSFTEMMMALAVLDLPFTAGEHDYRYKDGGMVFTAASDVILFHRQVQRAEGDIDKSVLLVNQSFFAHDDRYRFENNERFDKFVTAEFEKGRVYGCQLVITNPTSTRRKVDILQQIPAGAIPVLGTIETRSTRAVLQPYSTQAQEYYFYFPKEGEYPHYPVHVAQNEMVIAAAEPFVFKVVAQVDRFDKNSWEHVSQFGTEDDVHNFLDAQNINRLKLEMIAWRMRNKPFFEKTLNLLEDRRVYSDILWSYALYHDVQGRIREYLVHTPLVNASGKILQSPLLDVDPIIRHIYEHKEYWPLVNARVFILGDKRKILNHQFYEQYESFMKVLTYRLELTDDDKMTVAVYMLLQDRIDEAMRYHREVDPSKLKMTVQYDYISAYMAFFRGEVEEARQIAEKYRDYPVDRWRNLFGEVLAQYSEIHGGSGSVVDNDSRDQTQAMLADTTPLLHLDIEGSVVKIESANVLRCRVNYYPTDIELLFSRKPFVQDAGTQFTFIKPRHSDIILPSGDTIIETNVPKELKGQNLIVEVTAAGISRQKAYHPNSLKVDIFESYGQLRVVRKKNGQPLPKVYIKVYARTGSGQIEFYKDGYTDLRGRFDYSSLNSDRIDSVSRFAILVMSDDDGAMVREANPPKR